MSQTGRNVEYVDRLEHDIEYFRYTPGGGIRTYAICAQGIETTLNSRDVRNFRGKPMWRDVFRIVFDLRCGPYCGFMAVGDGSQKEHIDNAASARKFYSLYSVDIRFLMEAARGVQSSIRNFIDIGSILDPDSFADYIEMSHNSPTCCTQSHFVSEEE